MIYAIKGVGFIFDFKADAGATIHEFQIESIPPKEQVQDFILQKLRENDLKIPKNTELRFHRGTPTMGGLKYNIILGKNKTANL